MRRAHPLTPTSDSCRSKFRTCGDTGFCKTFREANELPKVRGQAWRHSPSSCDHGSEKLPRSPRVLSQFRLDEASLKLDEKSGFLGAKLLGEGGGLERPVDLSLTVRFYGDGTSRVKIVESRPIRPRWEPPGTCVGSFRHVGRSGRSNSSPRHPGMSALCSVLLGTSDEV